MNLTGKRLTDLQIKYLAGGLVHLETKQIINECFVLLLALLICVCVCVCVSGISQVVDERMVTMGFHQWLASVTERIHQTMHYQFDGKAEACLVHFWFRVKEIV